MEKLKVLDLFSGIGGFSLGLERTGGFETVAFCEIDKYCQRVLKKHWPEVPCYDDVREITADRLDRDGISRPDVITGGFPCQDISIAGKKAGINGKRSGLWSELCRIIGEVQPKYAVMENVTALISGDKGRWFGRVLGDLAEIGYDSEWHCIPASAIGAHHHRDRVWIIAYPSSIGLQGFSGIVQGQGEGWQIIKRGQIARTYSKNTKPGGIWFSESGICRVADGIPNRAHRLRSLGNAVVPQIPELIGRAILGRY